MRRRGRRYPPARGRRNNPLRSLAKAFLMKPSRGTRRLHAVHLALLTSSSHATNSHKIVFFLRGGAFVLGKTWKSRPCPCHLSPSSTILYRQRKHSVPVIHNVSALGAVALGRSHLHLVPLPWDRSHSLSPTFSLLLFVSFQITASGRKLVLSASS